ncbi:MAG: hypothetical protein IIU30_05840, partial [Treponema sp.]|nr:hypothetical protein [Treponema sp.]
MALEGKPGQYYKKILDTLSTAVLVATPIYGQDGSITDFSIDYTNAAFEELTKSYIHPGDKLSGFQHLLS